MIAAELRGGNKPSLEEALGWIGSRVDDIYGANVGRLEDVWIDPGSGLPRWLLVKGRFSGRTTLIPFDHATAGAGHVWVPYEREVVRDAPEIQAGARPTAAVEAALLAHYAQRAPGEAIGTSAPEPRVPHFQSRPVARPRRQVLREQPRPQPTGHADEFPVYRPLQQRPAPPVEPRPTYPAPRAHPQPSRAPVPAPVEGGWTVRQSPPVDRASWQPPPRQAPAPQQAAPVEEGGWAVGSTPVRGPEPRQPHPPPPPAPAQPSPTDTIQNLAASTEVSDIEIDLSGEISIRGEIIRIRIVPRS